MEKLAILRSYTYESYLQLSDDLLKNNGTTGDDQSEEHIKYTALNHTRMERWNKTLQLSDALKQTLQELKNKMEWVVISESWCGDSAQIIPVLAKMEQESAGKISLRIIFSDCRSASARISRSFFMVKAISRCDSLRIWSPAFLAASIATSLGDFIRLV